MMALRPKSLSNEGIIKLFNELSENVFCDEITFDDDCNFYINDESNFGYNAKKNLIIRIQFK